MTSERFNGCEHSLKPKRSNFFRCKHPNNGSLERFCNRDRCELWDKKVPDNSTYFVVEEKIGGVTANRLIWVISLCIGAGIGLIYLPESFVRVSLGLFVWEKIYNSLHRKKIGDDDK